MDVDPLDISTRARDTKSMDGWLLPSLSVLVAVKKLEGTNSFEKLVTHNF